MTFPSRHQVDRFRRDLEALTGAAPERLGVALSGGPDSLALLLLAHAAFPGQVEAATVDHRLRPESAAEAAFAAEVCERLDVAHATLSPAEPIAGNLQASARRARYALLDGWREARGRAWLLTAHHADDQAETLLMRLRRGAGVGGLAGVRAVNGRILRPLLGWRRAELATIVAAAGIEPVADPSNEDDRFDRARLRKRLADADWLDPLPLARSAAALAEADEALDWVADRLWGDRVTRAEADEIHFVPGDLPPELVRRLLVRILAALNPQAAPRGAELGRLAATLSAGGTATLAGVRCIAGEHCWAFAPAPPRRRR